ncbi:MAG: glutathione S-transferase [Hahellaceae bacterium]|nr:glutathione S-transferase [Hahellaceae bacterium]MCP5170139.1 glutathione S-transferase [Hahellaceae bacterium]
MSDTLVLNTFSISHFSEKIRWTLDKSHIAYREKPWTPFFHVLPALVKGGKATTVPILKIPGGYVQDSTAILMWLEKHCAPVTLIPTDAKLREAVWQWEDKFDRMGSHIIRYAYSEALNFPDAVIDVWTLDANRFQKAVLKRSFPVLQKVFRKLLGISSVGVARSRQVVEQSLEAIAQQIASGERYLVGGQLTVADITAASLLAPLVCPDEHPVYSRPMYRESMKAITAQYENHPAFAWVKEMYRMHRRQ